MATSPLTLSVSRPRFGRRERTEIRAHFARDVLADMKAAYFADDRPWVVGFSGGKDSTALVQLFYYYHAGPPEMWDRRLAGQTQTDLHSRLRDPRGRVRLHSMYRGHDSAWHHDASIACRPVTGNTMSHHY